MTFHASLIIWLVDIGMDTKSTACPDGIRMTLMFYHAECWDNLFLVQNFIQLSGPATIVIELCLSVANESAMDSM